MNDDCRHMRIGNDALRKCMLYHFLECKGCEKYEGKVQIISTPIGESRIFDLNVLSKIGKEPEQAHQFIENTHSLVTLRAFYLAEKEKEKTIICIYERSDKGAFEHFIKLINLGRIGADWVKLFTKEILYRTNKIYFKTRSADLRGVRFDYIIRQKVSRSTHQTGKEMYEEWKESQKSKEERRETPSVLNVKRQVRKILSYRY